MPPGRSTPRMLRKARKTCSSRLAAEGVKEVEVPSCAVVLFRTACAWLSWVQKLDLRPESRYNICRRSAARFCSSSDVVFCGGYGR